jgi:hypothetical protein
VRILRLFAPLPEDPELAAVDPPVLELLSSSPPHAAISSATARRTAKPPARDKSRRSPRS